MNSNTNKLIGAALLGAVIALLPIRVEAQRSGVEMWSQTCGNCHTIQPANRYTADQWETIMMDMRIFARLTSDETTAILDFLKGGAKRLAAEPAPRGPNVTLLATTEPSIWFVPIDPETDYQRQCVACHGEKGEGNGPAAIALNPKPTDFTDPEFHAARTDEELAEAITNGKNTMPGFAAQFSSEQIAALVTYLRLMANPEQ